MYHLHLHLYDNTHMTLFKSILNVIINALRRLQQLWNGHLWSPSFFMSTLGNMSKDVVAQYIQNQLTEFNAGRPRQ